MGLSMINELRLPEEQGRKLGMTAGMRERVKMMASMTITISMISE